MPRRWRNCANWHLQSQWLIVRCECGKEAALMQHDGLIGCRMRRADCTYCGREYEVALQVRVREPQPQGGTINRNDLLAVSGEATIRAETLERLEAVRRENERAVRELFRGPDGPDPVREALTRDKELGQ